MWVVAKDRNASCLTGKRKTRNGTVLRVVNRCVLQRWPFDRDNPCGRGTEARRPLVPITVSPKPAGPSIGFAAIRVASLRIADRGRGSRGCGRGVDPVPGTVEARKPLFPAWMPSRRSFSSLFGFGPVSFDWTMWQVNTSPGSPPETASTSLCGRTSMAWISAGPATPQPEPASASLLGPAQLP